MVFISSSKVGSVLVLAHGALGRMDDGWSDIERQLDLVWAGENAQPAKLHVRQAVPTEQRRVLSILNGNCDSTTGGSIPSGNGTHSGRVGAKHTYGLHTGHSTPQYTPLDLNKANLSHDAREVISPTSSAAVFEHQQTTNVATTHASSVVTNRTRCHERCGRIPQCMSMDM